MSRALNQLGASLTRAFRLRRTVFVVVAALVLLIGAVSFNRWLELRNLGATTQDELISLQANVAYCTEGDSVAPCDPSSGQTSGSGQSNSIVLVKPIPTPSPSPTPTPTPSPGAVCLKLALEGRSSDQSHAKVRVTVKNASGVQVASRDATAASDGAVTINDSTFVSALNDATLYNLTVKPVGFVSRTATNVLNITSRCVDTTATPMLLGDFTGDDAVKIDDIVAIIQAYNGVHRQETLLAFAGNQPKLSDIVTVIRHYNGL